ncbi:MAG: type IV-A pilus assembly ATPase PilB [Candidatus Eisenbacteria bacterium]|uniref:protein-secreting ATPase n=1 Tax=Eiseniibacteriota bacterium TaxID=2212470 RepID=A0A956LY21_UNCEI|nr:type IV-A pilus assembly ATPase PilB [Candidatus Eisenbacteria bacterium]
MKIDVGLKLVQANLIDEDQLRRAREIEKTEGTILTSTLVKLGVIAEDRLLQFLSELYETPPINLQEIDLDPLVAKLLPAEVASKFQVVPVGRNGRVLKVAMANPANFFAIDDIKFITGCEVSVFVATEGQIKVAIDSLYDSSETMQDVINSIQDEVEVVEHQEEDYDSGGAEEAPVVKFVNTLIAEAVRRGASDIHIEPYERKLRVRFRIDGVLYEMMSPPIKMKSAIISRIKIMAELDIAEKRVPQDGRIKIRLTKKTIDLRVSTLPTIFGEKVVMRILDKSNLALDLTKLGFDKRSLDRFIKAIESPYGMVLVTGPTGSGKTTTLYSALSRINIPDTNIMTAEDPVEYNIDGINQVNVNDAIDLTFAAALRAFLRQDPNVVMVGEIRDKETASIAIKAALTGHLVLSTLHTNDAPSTLNRLIDMGVEPFLVASSVNLILAQRLVRRLCEKCKEPLELSDELMAELELTPDSTKGATPFQPKGCYDCNDTGYRGRQGIYEVMLITPAVRDLILEHRPTSEIKVQAVKEGMLTLRMDALEKLKLGMTSVEEVLKESAADQLG